MSDTLEDPDESQAVEPQSSPIYSEEEIIENLLSSSSVKLQHLIPTGCVKSESVIKVANWILTSHSKKRGLSVINQRIKWITAVVQYGVVESVNDLGKLFNPLIQLIFTEKYQASICHLLYLIATPKIYKFQVERISKCVNTLGLTKPLAGLLSRLKSLRPDLVPQTIPHQSSAVSFPKAPATIRNGFYALSNQIKDRNELTPSASDLFDDQQQRVTKKMRLNILPRIQHINLKSSFEVDFQKMILLPQFKTFDALVQKITAVEMPNHIGSLLSRREFHYVLALNFTPGVEALLSQWIYLTLCHEFIEKDQMFGKPGKELLLNRIIEFQQSTGRKLMAVYDFLSEYLQSWDGIQYCDQIFQLIADVPFLPYSDLYENFLFVLEQLFHSCETNYRLKIIHVCRQLILNLLLDKFGPTGRTDNMFHISSTASPEEILQIVEALYVVSEMIRFTERLLNMALTSSTHVTLLCCSLNFYLWLIDIEEDFKLPFRTFCQPITTYSALYSAAPVTLSLLCQLLCRYQVGKTSIVNMTGIHPEFEEFSQISLENAKMFYGYMVDTSKSLIYKKAFISDSNSLLSKIPARTTDRLNALGSCNAAFDLIRHPAFAGVAREWIISKSDSKELVEEMKTDSDGYIRFLFGCFPAIKEFVLLYY